MSSTSTSTATDQTVPAEVGMRIVATVGVLIGGLVHIELYFNKGYRAIPNANLGRSFILNGIVSILVAAALLIRRDVIVRLGGVAVTVGTLIAFYLSRHTDSGVFGFTEKVLSPSPEAALALIAEIVALVVLAVSFVPALGWRRKTVGPRTSPTAARSRSWWSGSSPPPCGPTAEHSALAAGLRGIQPSARRLPPGSVGAHGE